MRYHKAFDDENAFERMLQHEARRQIKYEESHEFCIYKGTKKIKTVEEEEDETMKQFKNRIREETSKTLRDEISKLTSIKKGKTVFDRKEVQKSGRDILLSGLLRRLQFRQDGYLRHSDLGGSDEFEKRQQYSLAKGSINLQNLIKLHL